MLNELIFKDIFNIDTENFKDQDNVGYTRLADDAIKSVDRSDYQCAFIMNKTKIEQIKKVSDNGCKMPQKSTYFYPKIITGMVMNKLD